MDRGEFCGAPCGYGQVLLSKQTGDLKEKMATESACQKGGCKAGDLEWSGVPGETSGGKTYSRWECCKGCQGAHGSGPTARKAAQEMAGQVCRRLLQLLLFHLRSQFWHCHLNHLPLGFFLPFG